MNIRLTQALARRMFAIMRPRPTVRGVSFVLGLAMMSALLFIGSAAAVTSGTVFKARETLNGSRVINACAEATVVTGGDFQSFARSRQPVGTSCSSGYAVPGGYLGASFYGYMNGSFCGVGGPAYTTGTTSDFGIGGAICGNPSGLQNFFTNGYSDFYKGPSYPYNNGYVIYFTQSPTGSF